MTATPEVHFHVHIHVHHHGLGSRPHANESRDDGSMLRRLLAVVRSETVLPDGEIWNAHRAYERLTATGWVSTSERPLNVVGNALGTLSREGYLVRIARGAYRLAPAEAYDYAAEDEYDPEVHSV